MSWAQEVAKWICISVALEKESFINTLDTKNKNTFAW